MSGTQLDDSSQDTRSEDTVARPEIMELTRACAGERDGRSTAHPPCFLELGTMKSEEYEGSLYTTTF